MAHHDRGSQYTLVVYSERLAADASWPSVGVVGSFPGDALTDTITGLQMIEPAKGAGLWCSADQPDVATAEWVDWFNN